MNLGNVEMVIIQIVIVWHKGYFSTYKLVHGLVASNGDQFLFASISCTIFRQPVCGTEVCQNSRKYFQIWLYDIGKIIEEVAKMGRFRTSAWNNSWQNMTIE